MTPVRIDRAAIGELRTLVGDDGRSLAEQLLEIFAKDAPLLVAQLQRAAPAADGAELLRLAHRLKGTALTIGADTVTAHCVHIERRVRLGEFAEVAALLDELAIAAAETVRLLHEELERLAGL